MSALRVLLLFGVMLSTSLVPVSLADDTGLLQRMGLVKTDFQIYFNDTRLEVLKQGLVVRSVSEQDDQYGFGYREWFLEVMYKNKGNLIDSGDVQGVDFINRTNESLYHDDDYPLITSFFLPKDKAKQTSWYFLAINLEDIPFLILEDTSVVRLSGVPNVQENQVDAPVEEEVLEPKGDIL